MLIPQESTKSTSKPGAIRLAYLVSHPIQYQAPLLRLIAAHPQIDLTVFFLSDFSVRSYVDAGFGQAVEWDVPLLEGYKHVFLPHLGKSEGIKSRGAWNVGIRKHLQAGKFDALWMHGYAHPSNLRALLEAKRLGIKVLLRAESQLNSALRSSRTAFLKEAFVRRIFRLADGYLSIGTLNRNYYLHYGVPEKKIFSMPYAVDNAFFQARCLEARPNRDALRDELNLDPQRPVILYASKFVGRKRAGDLLEAYIKLSPDGTTEPKPYLLLIGDGEERPALEERAKKTGWSSIRFLGFKNQTQLPAFFDLCDAFVLVSEREPWGLIVNEVMNAAKPVIVSDEVGSALDLVVSGENGFVLSVGDIDGLAEALQRVTSDEELAENMGQKSLEKINRWGLEEDVQGLLQALRATLSRKG